MQFFSSQAKLGILGGWSTRQKCCSTSPANGTSTHMFSTPVQTHLLAFACDHFVQGDFKDYQTVYDFGKNLDVLTIEIEHVNTDALRQLEKGGRPTLTPLL